VLNIYLLLFIYYLLFLLRRNNGLKEIDLVC